MKHIKFNKTICGVDFLLNVIDPQSGKDAEYSCDLQTADFFQIVFINKAQGHLKLNAQSIELKDYSIIFISQDQQHQWQANLDDIDATFLVFQEDFLNEFFSDKYFTYRLLYFYQTELPLFLESEKEIIESYLSKLKEIKVDLEEPQNDSVHLIRSVLYYLLIKLNRSYAEQYQLASSISNENIAYEFRQLVEKNIYSKQRIEDYTELMNVSRITLNKAVKKQFNSTTTAFIKSRLAFEIKMKLIYTQKTVEELAYLFKFSEPNHLSRFFKTQTGFTPIAYRDAYQNGSSSF